MESILWAPTWAPTMPATSTTPDSLKESQKKACRLFFHRKTNILEKEMAGLNYYL